MQRFGYLAGERIVKNANRIWSLEREGEHFFLSGTKISDQWECSRTGRRAHSYPTENFYVGKAQTQSSAHVEFLFDSRRYRDRFDQLGKEA